MMVLIFLSPISPYTRPLQVVLVPEKIRGSTTLTVSAALDLLLLSTLTL